jgi:pimeloyl-ACP methyl ester carboxylesterase
MEAKVLDFFGKAGAVDWSSEQSVIDFVVGRERVLIGSKHEMDEERLVRLATEDIRRTKSVASMNNHGLLSGGEAYLTRTSEIEVPALIIHGTEDPIIPYAHGENLASAIPNAKLLPLTGTGHELHRNDWDVIINGIVDITS